MSVEAPRAKAIFLDAVGRYEPHQWPQYLREACAGDDELRRRVEVLLRAHAESAGLLDALGHESAPTVDRDPAAERVGSSVGPYRLMEQVGEGGMGAVYVAEQSKPVRRKVALKIIKPGMDTKQVIARFEAERQALAMMDHPNIARVLDGGATESGRPYFVMELVRGIPITDYCDRETLSIPERLELFVLVCRAVQHAHQKGVIHRDLKPSNILVTVIDGAAVPKVIDFGVAKATGAALTDRTVYTAFHQFVGTPLYMSPEQADLSGMDVDTRSDIYALGVLLYELLTGTTPFDQETFRRAALDEVRRLLREQEPPKPSTRLSSLGATRATVSANRKADPRHLDRAVRGELDWVVMKALEKDRRRRYETANDFAADVTRYLTHQPVEAGPPSVWYRFRKYARRNRAGLVTASLVASALVVGTAVSTWQAVRATRAQRVAAAARDAEARARKRAEGAEAAARAEADKAKAINDFLVHDLLVQAEPGENADPDRVTLREVLDRAADKVSARFRHLPLVEAALRETISDIYYGLGAWEKSRQQAAAMLAIYEREKGREAKETLRARLQVGEALIRQGRLAEAEALLRQALESSRRAFGEEHDTTLWALHGLAELYRHRSELTKAEPLYVKYLEGRRRTLGEGHNDTSAAMSKLAVLYCEQGKFSKAEPLLTQCLEAARRDLGEGHPNTLRALRNLAKVHQYLGKLAEAEPLLAKFIEASPRVLGEGHPETLEAPGDLAELYMAQGKLAEAEPLVVKALDGSRRALGEGHHETAGAMHQLARLYVDQGRHAEAEPLFVKALEVSRKALGEEHPQTMSIMHNLARLFTDKGRYAEAEPLLLKTLEANRRLAGEDAWATLTVMKSLAYLYRDQGKLSEAEALLVKSLEGRRRVFGEGHPRTLAAMDALAELYHRQGRRSEAEPLAAKVFEGRRRALGDEHQDTLSTMNLLAVLYLERGKPSQAEPLFTRALDLQRRVIGPENPSTLTTMDNLASLYEKLGQYEKAESLYRQLLESRHRVLGPEHRLTLSTADSLVRIILGKATVSGAERSRALEMARQTVKQAPQRNLGWKWLAVAEYCAGDWDAAIQATEKCIELRGDKGYVFQWLVLAVSHARRGEMHQAREWYAKAEAHYRLVKQWFDTPPKLIAEAEALLGPADLTDDVFARP